MLRIVRFASRRLRLFFPWRRKIFLAAPACAARVRFPAKSWAVAQTERQLAMRRTTKSRPQAEQLASGSSSPCKKYYEQRDQRMSSFLHGPRSEEHTSELQSPVHLV